MHKMYKNSRKIKNIYIHRVLGIDGPNTHDAQFITHHRLPAQKHLGLAYVWPSSLWIILSFWKELNMTAAH